MNLNHLAFKVTMLTLYKGASLSHMHYDFNVISHIMSFNVGIMHLLQADHAIEALGCIVICISCLLRQQNNTAKRRMHYKETQTKPDYELKAIGENS